MNEEKISLDESVLKLRLKEKTLVVLEYLNIFTISDLLEQGKNLMEQKEIFADIQKQLSNKFFYDEEGQKKIQIKIDSKLTYNESNARDKERKKIQEELNSRRMQQK